MSQSNVVTDSTPVPRFRDAYQTLLDEIRAVPDDELTIVNLDIPTAITTVLGALPQIRAMRPQIVAAMQKFDIARFDKLEAYTMAVGYANSLYLAASQPSESIEKLAGEGGTVRDLLVAEATTLAQRRLIDGQRLKDLKGANGYRNLATDLFTLAAMVRDVWPTLGGKTTLQLAELDQAETLGDRLLTAVGQREQGPAVVATSAENRQRAFTLFINAYDEVRRAVTFLRWHEEDVEEIAPSLYGRPTRRKSSSDAPVPVVPAAAKPAAATGGEHVQAALAGANVKSPIGVGLPDSEPFITR
jgi:hypothetical protein